MTSFFPFSIKEKKHFSVLELPNPNIKTHIKADLEVLDILKVKYKKIVMYMFLVVYLQSSMIDIHKIKGALKVDIKR